MKGMLKEAVDNLRLLKEQIDELLERYRVKYYYEFILSVFCYGLMGTYALFVWARVPSLVVYTNTTFEYNLSQSLIPFDIVAFFFTFTPFFSYASEAALFFAGMWATTKLWHHSLVKVSEIELIPLPERIKKIEKEGVESKDE